MPGAGSGLTTGLLNLNKPAGISSHGAVARVRRLAGQKAVGHAGTLDPLATGVLVLLLGRATSLSAYVMGSRKVYQAEIELGVATETDDGEGDEIRRAPVPDVTADEMRVRLQSLTGEVMQRPPKYSALKRGGQTSYRAARKGLDLELEPRPVSIHSIIVLDWTPPLLRVRVETGPGAYIRSMARDVGELFDSAAHLAALERTASGRFRVEDAVGLDDLTQDSIINHVLSPELAVLDLPELVMSETDVRRVSHGMPIVHPSCGVDPSQSIFRLHGPDGRLVALARIQGSELRPFKVLEPA